MAISTDYDLLSPRQAPPPWATEFLAEMNRRMKAIETSPGALEAVDLLAQRVNVLEARIQVLMDLLAAKIK